MNVIALVVELHWLFRVFESKYLLYLSVVILIESVGKRCVVFAYFQVDFTNFGSDLAFPVDVQLVFLLDSVADLEPGVFVAVLQGQNHFLHELLGLLKVVLRSWLPHLHHISS